MRLVARIRATGSVINIFVIYMEMEIVGGDHPNVPILNIFDYPTTLPPYN